MGYTISTIFNQRTRNVLPAKGLLGLLGGTCDNQFDFCVRTVGSSQCLVTLSSDEIEDNSLTFTIDELDDLSISNPLRFTSIATTVSSVCMCVFMFMFYVYMCAC